MFVSPLTATSCGASLVLLQLLLSLLLLLLLWRAISTSVNRSGAKGELWQRAAATTTADTIQGKVIIR